MFLSLPYLTIGLPAAIASESVGSSEEEAAAATWVAKYEVAAFAYVLTLDSAGSDESTADATFAAAERAAGGWVSRTRMREATLFVSILLAIESFRMIFMTLMKGTSSSTSFK